MPVKLIPPGPRGQQPTVVVTSQSTQNNPATGGTTGGSTGGSTGGTSGSDAGAIDNLAQVVGSIDYYDKIPPHVHAPDYQVSDAMVVDADQRVFANSISLTGTLLVRGGAFLQVLNNLDNGGIIDNFSVIDVGCGATITP